MWGMEERMFFFEKKNQKTFASLVAGRSTAIASVAYGVGAKVFCCFFSKKKTLPSCLLNTFAAGPNQYEC
jgi:hypothetical protein